MIFPGGFGTMDELFEILTLAQTRKLESKIVIVLYGSKFWKEVLNFEALVKHGTIDEEDLRLFQYADDPETALGILQEQLSKHFLEPEKPLPEPGQETPQIAKSRVSAGWLAAKISTAWIVFDGGSSSSPALSR